MESVFQKKANRDQPPAQVRKVLARLYRYMFEFRGLFFALLGLLIFSLGADLLQPLVIERAINAISYANGISVDFRSLGTSIGMLVCLSLLNALLGWALSRFSARITLKISMKLREDAFRKISAISVSDFESMRRGDLMSRMMNDCELAAGAFTNSFQELFSGVIMIVGCAVIMFIKCAQLAAVSVGTAVISVFIMGALSGLVLPAFTRQQASLGQLNAHTEESLKAFKTCSAGGRTKENQRLMSLYSRDFYTKRLQACRLEYMMGPIMILFGNLNFLLTILFGVRQMSAGVITLGALQAFVMFSRQFMEPLNSLGDNFVMVQNALAGAERIFAVIDKKDEKEEIAKALPADNDEDRNSGFLDFKALHFAYHKNHPVLLDVNLNIVEGEHIALVGKTGEGKTTLSNLLLLFYPRYGGRICYEGKELRSISPEILRRKVTVVSQEPQLIEGTVFNNLTYGSEEPDKAEVERVLHDMGADSFILQLPQGLDTEIRNAGEKMSQGQMQLICLARALLRNTPVLILDEATASMDPETELVVKQGTELAMKGRTCIIIAHRLASVIDADRIAVLSDGVITECGTHENLIKENGVYRKLFETQFLGEEI